MLPSASRGSWLQIGLAILFGTPVALDPVRTPRSVPAADGSTFLEMVNGSATSLLQDTVSKTAPKLSEPPRHLLSDTFELWSEVDVDLAELAQIAEETRRRMSTWLEMLTPERGTPRTEIRVFRSVASSEDYLRSRQLGPAGPNDGGGAYARENLIVMYVPNRRHVETIVVHEVSHLLLDRFFNGKPREFVDEGLANLIPDWILNSTDVSPETNVCPTIDRGQEGCARLVRSDRVPAFSNLLRQNSRAFYDPSAEDENYALAFQFVRLLVESPQPDIAGRFRRFLHELRRSRTIWDGFGKTYDAAVVEKLFRSQLERESAWDLIHGGWLQSEGRMDLFVQNDDSACIAWPEPPVAGRAFRVAFTALSEPPAQGELGFLFSFVNQKTTWWRMSTHTPDDGGLAKQSREVGSSST